MTFTFGDPPEAVMTLEQQLAQTRADLAHEEKLASYWQGQHVQATQLVGILLAQLEAEYPDGVTIDLDGLKDAPSVEVLRVEETEDWSTERVLRVKHPSRRKADDS